LYYSNMVYGASHMVWQKMWYIWNMACFTLILFAPSSSMVNEDNAVKFSILETRFWTKNNFCNWTRAVRFSTTLMALNERSKILEKINEVEKYLKGKQVHLKNNVFLYFRLTSSSRFSSFSIWLSYKSSSCKVTSVSKPSMFFIMFLRKQSVCWTKKCKMRVALDLCGKRS
jgi:hypothetical protein